jgi:hypothetical protein
LLASQCLHIGPEISHELLDCRKRVGRFDAAKVAVIALARSLS